MASRLHKLLLLAVILFVAALALITSSNPYRLLIPGDTFPTPFSDQREAISLYGYLPGSDDPIEWREPINLSEELQPRIRHIAAAIARPGRAGSRLDEESPQEVVRLPEFGFAIRYAWLHEESRLLIDLHGETIANEADEFLRKVQQDETLDQITLSDRYFRALALSLLANLEIEQTDYLIDGRPATGSSHSPALSKSYSKKQ